jgi:hypothetical protein
MPASIASIVDGVALDRSSLIDEPALPARVDTEDLVFDAAPDSFEYEDRTSLDTDLEFRAEPQRLETFDDSTHVDHTDDDAFAGPEEQTMEDASATAKTDQSAELRAQILSGAFPREERAAAASEPLCKGARSTPLLPRAAEAETKPDRPAPERPPSKESITRPRAPSTKPTLPAIPAKETSEEETFLDKTASVVEADTLNLASRKPPEDDAQQIEADAIGGIRVRWVWFAPVMMCIVAAAAFGTWALLTSKPL